MNKILVTLAAILIPLAPCVAQAQNPKAPNGYQWVTFSEVNATFLKPDGWHFHKENKDKNYAAFISKEKIEGGRQYQTGMSVNVIRNLADKQGHSAYEFSLALREENRKVVKIDKEWGSQNGPFQSVGYAFTHKGPDSTFRCYNILISNIKTGTLYIFTFEAPAAEWEKAWKIGEPIIQRLGLDDEI